MTGSRRGLHCNVTITRKLYRDAAKNFQTGLEVSVIATELAGAVWLGNDDPLGHTFWQTIDSSSIAGISSTALKYAFSRAPLGADLAGRLVGGLFQAILGLCCIGGHQSEFDL